MANLLSNTTIGGYQSIHTGNIGSYAITSLSGYATQSYVTSQGYITNTNQYYYVNPGAGNGIGFWTQAPTTYGITMAHTSAGYGAIYDNSEYYLYFSITSGGNRGFIFRNDYGAIAQLASTGWLMTRGEIYPGYNNGGGAGQTSYYIYGNTNSGGIRTNGNWIVNGDIYLGTRDAWLSSWLNQSVRTDSNPTFASIYLNGTQLTGTQTQQLKNTLDNTGLPYKCDIVINGDPDTFYPVHFIWGNQDVWRRIIINRGYAEQAPWDPIGTGAHHGGLLIDWEGNFGGWGGAEYSDRLRVFNQSYTDVCADMYIYTHSMGYVFMLRGGGATGAIYHIYSDQEIRGYNQVGTPDIAYNTSTKFYNGGPSYPQYDVYAPAPLTLAQVNSSRIDGLRTKKQSLLDNRYLRQGVDISGIGTVSATNFLASNAFYLNSYNYYLNSSNGGIYTNARFETAGNLVVGGNSYLGNGNGDEVHINDILRVGATDSGDAHFYFGEGSLAGSDYGAHLYWDSGYRFTWYTRNAGTDSTLFYYDTNSLSYITWGRSLSMNTNSIDYTGQLHFSGGTRFQSMDTHYLKFRTDATDYGSIQVRDANESVKGYLGYFDSNGFGLLNSAGNWGIRLNPGNIGTDLFYAGNIKLATLSEGTRIYGNLHLDDNYGYGIVGAYSSSRYQGIFAMGNAYKLSADGTSTGNLYGLAWSHPDAGGQTKGGLEHQLLVMNYGVTQTAIGSGIWTNGLITTTSYGTSANWKSAYDWGNHASAGYQSASTAITTSNIGSQSVSYASTAGSLSSMNISQFTNNSGYLTGITSGQVTGALGYTPYNSSNPSGYITSGDTTTGIFTTFLGNATSNISSGYTRVIRNENGAGGAPNYAPILHVAASDTMWQIAGAHAGQTTLVWRSGYSGAWNTPWWTIYHSGNFTDNSSNWNTAYSWGNHASAGYLTSASLSGYATQSYVNSQGFLTSLPSHNHDDRYYTESESDSRYLSINGGTVTGWALFTASTQGTAIVRATQQDTSAGYYLFQGITGSSEVFRVERTGRLNSVEYIYSYGYRGNGNVGGTGTASWHPDGIYCGSTMWQYGTMYKNNTGIYGVSEIQLNAGLYLQTYNDRNLIVKGNSSSDAGIEGRNSAGSNVFQIYGNGNDYGFLNGTWAAWDIRKTKNGALYMNDTSGYYLYTNGTSNFYALNIQGSAVVHAGNIGSQSVTYATNSTRLYASDSPYTYGGAAPYYLYMNYDGGSYWELKVSPATPGAVRVAYSNVSGSANSVAWTNVSSRPTALSQFTNDLGNYGGWITSSGSISGNAATATNVAWTGVTGRPTALSQFSNDLGNYGGWLTTGGKAADSELFDGTDSIYFVKGNGANTLGRRTTNLGGNSAQGLSSGFYDGSGMSNMPTSDWYHLIVNAHYNSATNNQYEFQLATAFWDKSNFYVRSISPGDVGPWRTLIHNGNIGSQSVNYANSAGSATSATTATTATVASQLNKFGDIYGQDWNTYYIQDKFIAAAVYGHSGANRPVTTYDYGVALSYGEASGPVMQMYFPENSPNLGTIFRKAHYRTGWNGNWSTWKTIVEQEGNTCTIVGGNQTGMEIHANVGYNQDPLTYFLLRGQADTSWKALKIRLTGDAGGQDIEFRRIAENGADARMFYVPRGANQVIFEYQFVQGSDSRLKDNIIPITNSLDKVKSLRGVEFDWNSGVNEGTHDVGLIAQDVEAVLPEAVTTQEDGYKNLAYTKVIPLLVEAMKEQQVMIDALKAEIELLKNK